MFDLSFFHSYFLPFILPPLLGAFIGYLTNKIAIKMLFRPLKRWYIWKIPVPMTPGVIPAKRHQLAKNIGEMVGFHLLTGTEIVKAIKKESFQTHLNQLITARFREIINKEYGALEVILPQKYKSFIRIAETAVTFKIRRFIIQYLHSSACERILADLVEYHANQLLEKDIDRLCNYQQREKIYALMEVFLNKIIKSSNLQTVLEDYIAAYINSLDSSKSTLQDILPAELISAGHKIIRNRIPDFIQQITGLLQENETQRKIAETIKEVVDDLAESMGPMGSMVQGFLTLQAIEGLVSEYIKNNYDEIEENLLSEKFQSKIATIVCRKIDEYLEQPVSVLLHNFGDITIEKLGIRLSGFITKILQNEKTAAITARILRDNIEIYIEAGNKRVETVLADFASDVKTGQKQLINLILEGLRSEKTSLLLDSIISTMLRNFLGRPIGKISKILPDSISADIAGKAVQLSSTMLVAETPELVQTLKIQQMVSEKIDTLDLLKLEGLLLSIMQEQFRYINIFGALIGFLIGCCNVLLLYLI